MFTEPTRVPGGCDGLVQHKLRLDVAERMPAYVLARFAQTLCAKHAAAD